MSPQTYQVLKHLIASGSITNVEAHAVLKCRSVSKRISELVNTYGLPVAKVYRRDSTGQRFVRYVLTNTRVAIATAYAFYPQKLVA